MGGKVVAGRRLGSSVLRMWPLGPTFYFLHFLGRGPAWCGVAAVPGTARVTDCTTGNITSYHGTAAGHRGASDREMREAPEAQYFPSFTPPRVQVQADDEVQSPVRSGAGETQIVRHWLGWLGWAGLGWPRYQLSAGHEVRLAGPAASCAAPRRCGLRPLQTKLVVITASVLPWPQCERDHEPSTTSSLARLPSVASSSLTPGPVTISSSGVESRLAGTSPYHTFTTDKPTHSLKLVVSSILHQLLKIQGLRKNDTKLNGGGRGRIMSLHLSASMHVCYQLLSADSLQRTDKCKGNIGGVPHSGDVAV